MEQEYSEKFIFIKSNFFKVVFVILVQKMLEKENKTK